MVSCALLLVSLYFMYSILATVDFKCSSFTAKHGGGSIMIWGGGVKSAGTAGQGWRKDGWRENQKHYEEKLKRFRTGTEVHLPVQQDCDPEHPAGV